MNCTVCNAKSCRTLADCKLSKSDRIELSREYHMTESQGVVQAAARLVDNGRAGTLSRLEEIIEFIQLMNYKKIGVAYCYGMEVEASILVRKLRTINNVKVLAVSCTTGSLAQDEVNEESKIHKVSCNPIAQAEQLNYDGAEFVLTMGLCLGHDIIFNRYIKGDTTTFVVKDRVNNHNPIIELRK